MKAVRVVLVAVLVITPVLPLFGQTCTIELSSRWVRFANDANTYWQELRAGQYDLRLRARVMRDWADLTSLECW